MRSAGSGTYLLCLSVVRLGLLVLSPKKPNIYIYIFPVFGAPQFFGGSKSAVAVLRLRHVFRRHLSTNNQPAERQASNNPAGCSFSLFFSGQIMQRGAVIKPGVL